MLQITIIDKSMLTEDKRIDSEYFLPEYIKLEEILEKKEWLPLNELMHVSDGNHLTIAEQYVKTGVRYLRAKDLSKYFVKDADPVYIPKSFFSKLKRSHIKENDVLLSIVGTIGNLGLVKNAPKKLTANCKLAILRSKKTASEFIYIFLISKFGQYQIKRMTRGTVQQGLILPDLRKIKVTNPSDIIEKQIVEFVNNAYNKRKNADELYKIAECKLLSELGINSNSFPHILTYSTPLSDIKTHDRFDAEYYQPACVQLEKFLIEKHGAKSIGKLDFIDVTTGQYSEKYVDAKVGKPYIRGTDLKNGTIDNDDLYYISVSDQKPDKIAKEGDVVVTRVGTIGLSARIPKECDGSTLSDNLVRLRFDQKYLNSFYLVLYLGSIVGRSLMIRNSRGSVQQRLNQETLKEVVIPILNKKFRQHVAQLVIQSQQELNDAVTLVKIAKKAVEVYVQEGESKALSILNKL